MAACDLCDLPTPDPPVTADDVDGAFCCAGCLAVTRELGAMDAADLDTARAELEADAGDIDPTGTETAFLSVEGMHCATCEVFIESRARRESGIVGAEASYAAGLVKLTYDPDRISSDELPAVLTGLGYTARDAATGTPSDGEPPWRLLLGAFLAMPVMLWYVVFLYPRYFGYIPDSPSWTGATGPVSLVNLWLLSTLVLAVAGYPILRGAYVSLRAGRPNMDLLVALAAVNAYVYSGLVVLLGGTEVYFDIAVVIVLVVTLGQHYEHRIKRRAAGTLADLTQQGVDEARRRTVSGLEPVSLSELEPGDEVVVRPGERVPVDGVISEGTASVDESLLTGEARPVRRTAGDEVIGGAVVTDGSLVVVVPEDVTSTVDRLVSLLWEVQSSRPGAQRIADRIAAVFVPLVLVIAGAAIVWQFATGSGGTAALLTGLTVLVVSCPCALGLATPLAVASGVRAGLDRGLVVTDASVFETAEAADVVAFDKTGTLTTGEMAVLAADSKHALRLAAAVEAHSSHPAADAITAYAAPARGPVTDVRQHPGRGVSADVDGRRVIAGSATLFDEHGWTVADELRGRVDAVRRAGHVPVVIGWDGEARSLAVVGDEPRPGWEAVVTALSNDGHEIVVITGDEAAAATPFRDHPAVDRVFAGVPPEAKTAIVERLRAEGTTVMVGDGTNDAPALATADLGIALASGTAIAADAADVVVRPDDLGAVLEVFGIVGATNRRIKENLAWAFLYNVIAIPVAAAGLINPLVAALAMASSSLLVVGNSARSYGRTADRHIASQQTVSTGHPRRTANDSGGAPR